MDYITVDYNRKEFIVPEVYRTAGVKGDNATRTLPFRVKAIVDGDYDIRNGFIKVAWANAVSEYGAYNVSEYEIDGSDILFEFPLSSNLTKEAGTIMVGLTCFTSAREWSVAPVKLFIGDGINDPSFEGVFQESAAYDLIYQMYDELREIHSGMSGEFQRSKSELETTIANASRAKTQADTSLASLTNAIHQATDMSEISERLGNVEAALGLAWGVPGLEVDFANKSNKRLAGARGLNAGDDFNVFSMYGNRRRCNVADDGTINAFYGDAGYTDDGSNGQVMVYQPKFWYLTVPVEFDKQEGSEKGYHLRKVHYYVSDKPRPGFKVHPAFLDRNGNEMPYYLRGAYESGLYDASAGSVVVDTSDYAAITFDPNNDKLVSQAGVQPVSNLNKVQAEQLNQNRGSGWHLDTIQMLCADRLLAVIEAGTMNLQEAYGNGVVSQADEANKNCSARTGSTASLGNRSGSATSTIDYAGTAQTAQNKLAVSYRGVENDWGNIWKHINGINIWGDGTMGGGMAYTCSDFDFKESENTGNYKPSGWNTPNVSSYISAMGWSEDNDWLFVPSETAGANSSRPVGDNFFMTENLKAYRVGLVGGGWHSRLSAGGFYWHLAFGAGTRGRSIAVRSVYAPENS